MMINRSLYGLVVVASLLALAPAAVHAQSRPFSFDVRGAYGIPIGQFNDAVKNDFGFGAGVTLRITRQVGIYGGWARDTFGCDALVCADDSQVHLSGFEFGGKFVLPSGGGILPWFKAGLIAHKAEFDGDLVETESDRNYGFQAAVGLEYPLGQVLSVSPGLRLNVIDIDNGAFFASREIRHLSFDIGAHFNIPN